MFIEINQLNDIADQRINPKLISEIISGCSLYDTITDGVFKEESEVT